VDPVSGRSGTYTGQVSPETQSPHGVGCLKLQRDGEVLDGEWSRGRLVNTADAHDRSNHHQTRHPSRSRGRKESLSESLSRSCRFEDEDQEMQQHRLARQPSRSRRESLSHSIRFDEAEPQSQHHVRHPSRSRRELVRSLSRSCHFDEDDEDANSIGGENSLGSHGDHTVGTYSARESKHTLPKRSSGQFDRRPSRSYLEVKR
jgi:hypothetical protein